MGGDHLADERLHRLPVGDVHGVGGQPHRGGARLLRRAGEPVGPQVDRGHAGPAGEQGEHDVAADAAAAAGDHEDAPVDPHVPAIATPAPTLAG
nr:hypothetical protein [Nocardioides solisilvae]